MSQFVRNMILISFLTVPALAKNNVKDYIVGGQKVGAQDPIQQSTVGIFAPSGNGSSGSLCTGTLIRSDIALTAAHCIQPGGPKPVLIFGPDLHSPDAVHRQADAVAVNPKWATNQGRGMDQGDIALVKFDGGLPAGYKKVSTVGTDAAIKPGEKVTLAGYGINNAKTRTGAGILRKTQVAITNNRPGQSEMILDQTKGHGACHGDSGGPAYVSQGRKVTLAGVTNRGYPNNSPDDCKHQVVYTKVPAYKKWIASNEKKLEQGDGSSSTDGGGFGGLAKNTRAMGNTTVYNRPLRKTAAAVRAKAAATKNPSASSPKKPDDGGTVVKASVRTPHVAARLAIRKTGVTAKVSVHKPKAPEVNENPTPKIVSAASRVAATPKASRAGHEPRAVREIRSATSRARAPRGRMARR